MTQLVQRVCRLFSCAATYSAPRRSDRAAAVPSLQIFRPSTEVFHGFHRGG